MPFTEFLKLVSTLKLLYGTQVASIFFEDNIGLYYNLQKKDLIKRLNNGNVKVAQA